MQQAQQDPYSGLLYRVETVEKDIAQVKAQLNQYVPMRENDLRLQSISETVRRIEVEVSDTKKQITEMSTKLAAQRESQDKLQIRVLWGAISLVLGTSSLIVAGYVTHFFH